MEVIKRVNRECEASENGFLKATLNALEDMRIERLVRDEYIGAERNLGATANAVNSKFLERVAAKPEESKKSIADIKQIAPMAITWEGRKDYATDTVAECLELVDDELKEKIGRWDRALDKCDDTEDVEKLARAVQVECWGGEPVPEASEPHPTGSGDGEGDEEGEGGEGSGEGREVGEGGDGDGEGKGKGKGESGDEGGGGEGEGDGSQGDGEGGRSPSGQTPDESGGEGQWEKLKTTADLTQDVIEDFDAVDTVNGVANALGGTKRGVYTTISTAHDKYHHRSDAPDKYGKESGNNLGYHRMNRGTPEQYNAYLSQTAGKTNVIRRRFERALLATQMRGWDGGRERGHLDTRRLVSAYNGSPNVFKVREEVPEMDTALTILVDLSGSMGGYKAQVATQCAIAIVEAIDKTGVSYEVLGFNNTTGYDASVAPIPDGARDGGRAATGAYEFTRIEPLDIYQFKLFDEQLRHARGSLSSIERCVGGNNSDGEAVRSAYASLRARPEKRKVFLTLSDGSPACHTEHHGTLCKDLRNAINELTKDRVTCIGVGICDRSVEKYYPNHVVVNDLEELAGKAIDQIAKALLGQRVEMSENLLEAG